MTRLPFSLFSVEKRVFSLLPVIIAATVGRLQRLLSLASSNPAQPFLELLFVSAPSARRHCRISSSALPRFQIFQLLKRVSLRWKGWVVLPSEGEYYWKRSQDICALWFLNISIKLIFGFQGISVHPATASQTFALLSLSEVTGTCYIRLAVGFEAFLISDLRNSYIYQLSNSQTYYNASFQMLTEFFAWYKKILLYLQKVICEKLIWSSLLLRYYSLSRSPLSSLILVCRMGCTIFCYICTSYQTNYFLVYAFYGKLKL